MKIITPDRRHLALVALVVGLVALLGELVVGTASLSWAQDTHWPAAAEKRFEEARALAQTGKFAAAAVGYRDVADWPEGGDFPERAQALYLAALMLEDSRQLEKAIQGYEEVERRFPRSAFAGRAHDGAARLGLGGARGLELQRAYQAAWDVLYPATELVRRGRAADARPGLERSVALLADLLEKSKDDPRAKEVAASLAEALLALGRLDEAHAAFTDAVLLSRREAAKPGASELEKKDVGIKEDRLHECVRAIRRTRIDLAGRALVLFLVALSIAARPWRRWSRARTRLAVGLGAAVAAASGVMAAVSHAVLAREDLHEAVLSQEFSRRAFTLVAAPGALGSLVALAIATGLRGRRGAAIGGVCGVLAAIALAACLCQTFELFPFLDQEL